MTALTRDSIAIRGSGIVIITQPEKGFRFTLDSLLLADFCRIKPGSRILECGAGTGVISLLLAGKFSRTTTVAVEKLRTSAELCRFNIVENGLQDRISVIEEDLCRLRNVLQPGSFDVIVANPPYIRHGSGLRCPKSERRTARQEESSSLETWIEATSHFLKNRGACFFIFPANRTAEILPALKDRRLEPKRLRPVHPRQERPASLLLIEAVKAAGPGAHLLPPLVVHNATGGYTDELNRIYGILPDA